MGGFKGTDAREGKVGAAARRDARHTRDEPRAVYPATKPTKRWCLGVVGRAHHLAVGRYDMLKGWRAIFASWKVLYCGTCGRELEMYYGRGPRPEWLDG